MAGELSPEEKITKTNKQIGILSVFETGRCEGRPSYAGPQKTSIRTPRPPTGSQRHRLAFTESVKPAAGGGVMH